MSSFPSGYGPFGAGKIKTNGECLEAKEGRGGLRVGPLCDPFLGTNAVNGHFLQFPSTKASYVFKGEDSIFTINGVVRQLFAQYPVKQSDSEAWERRRFWGGGIGTGGGKALSRN